MKNKKIFKATYLCSELNSIIADFQSFSLDITFLEKEKCNYSHGLKVNNISVIVKLHRKDTFSIKFAD
ncbi:hypothetical protein BGC65_04565 [Listeria monocytogenes]|nr:hypothetical protein [Listeria monocytogenes]